MPVSNRRRLINKILFTAVGKAGQSDLQLLYTSLWRRELFRRSGRCAAAEKRAAKCKYRATSATTPSTAAAMICFSRSEFYPQNIHFYKLLLRRCGEAGTKPGRRKYAAFLYVATVSQCVCLRLRRLRLRLLRGRANPTGRLHKAFVVD